MRSQIPLNTENRNHQTNDEHRRPHLADLNDDELNRVLKRVGVADDALAMRRRQILSAAYRKGVASLDEATTLPVALRSRLENELSIARPDVVEDQTSRDGVRKWLLRQSDGREIETVHIPDAERGTLCVSSQVGCALTCRFCLTGTQRLARNLTAAEIVSQVLIARDRLDDHPARTDRRGERKISNVVFMGMGEPLYNFNNVRRAAETLVDGERIGISRRRVTLSTAGVAPMIEPCGREIPAMLAVSLHAPRDDLRDELVPLNRKHPIDELLAACRKWNGLRNARRITFEYVMLRDVNDSPALAKELAKRLRGIPAKINLIPFNPWEGADYKPSTRNAIETFADILNRAGYAAPVRRPRGRDIRAACGQLKSQSLPARRADLALAADA